MAASRNIRVGMVAEHSLVVPREHTIARSNQQVPSVFSTPAMIQWMEITAAKAIKPHLPEGWMPVGVHINVHHLAATPEGATVRFKATVTKVAGERVTFALEARDPVETIGEGTLVQALVELARFRRRVQRKEG